MLADALGRPLRFVVTAGQVGDITQAPDLLDGQTGKAVLADKAYGAICIRHRKGRAEVLLINGRRTGKWGIPKGGIETGETSSHAAAREAFEEAGVTGLCHEQSLGSFIYQKQGRPLPCRVSVHLMEVQRLAKTFPEIGVRTPRWFEGATAASLVTDAGLKAMLLSVA